MAIDDKYWELRCKTEETNIYDIVRNYCKTKFQSLEYFDHIQNCLKTGVLHISNPNSWSYPKRAGGAVDISMCQFAFSQFTTYSPWEAIHYHRRVKLSQYWLRSVTNSFADLYSLHHYLLQAGDTEHNYRDFTAFIYIVLARNGAVEGNPGARNSYHVTELDTDNVEELLQAGLTTYFNSIRMSSDYNRARVKIYINDVAGMERAVNAYNLMEYSMRRERKPQYVKAKIQEELVHKINYELVRAYSKIKKVSKDYVLPELVLQKSIYDKNFTNVCFATYRRDAIPYKHKYEIYHNAYSAYNQGSDSLIAYLNSISDSTGQAQIKQALIDTPLGEFVEDDKVTIKTIKSGGFTEGKYQINVEKIPLYAADFAEHSYASEVHLDFGKVVNIAKKSKRDVEEFFNEALEFAHTINMAHHEDVYSKVPITNMRHYGGIVRIDNVPTEYIDKVAKTAYKINKKMARTYDMDIFNSTISSVSSLKTKLLEEFLENGGFND